VNWLFDQPYTIAALGGGGIFFLAIAWVQTGRNALLMGLAGVALATILLLVLERQIVTDKEAVQQQLYAFAALVEKNDVSKLADCVVRSRGDLLKAAQSVVAPHKFTEARVTKIHAMIEHPTHQPPEIIVEFNASVTGTFMNGQLPDQTFQRWVSVTFWKEDDGQWRVANYDHDEPTRFMKKRDR
jgi:ketosteroid isomerase-like protein